MEIDVDKLRDYLIDCCGTAVLGGFPAAIADLEDIEQMDPHDLCETAESMGIDLRQFKA